MLEPDDGAEMTVEVSSDTSIPETVTLLEDDTFSPPPYNPNQRPPTVAPELPVTPSSQGESTVQRIRETLESTGDLKPQSSNPMAETFMVPPGSLEEAKLAVEDLDTLQDFEVHEDDSLDLDSDSDSMSLGDGLLDDLDDE
jgi:hypothetical protein